MKIVACTPVFFLMTTVLFCTAVCGQSIGSGEIELIGVASIAADPTDQSGLNDLLAEGLPHNQIGGISAIGHAGGDRYLLLADRGPQDGAVAFHCRYLTATISIAPESPSPVKLLIDRTTFLESGGLPYIGLSSVFAMNTNFAGRFDPEGICVGPSPDGNQELIYVSDEYGPQQVAFDFRGHQQLSYKLPAELLIASPGIDWQSENANNVSGRQSNRGLEGLTITPGGRYLVGIMQSPLLQDSRQAANGTSTGINVRIVRVDRERGDVAQFVYQLEDSLHVISEILAISETQFLVIDRDGAGGELASKKMINLFDISQASELPPNTVLPPFDLPVSIRPVTKSAYLDLLDKKYGLAGSSFPAKIEGLCFGPGLADGRQTLLVISDNDFMACQPTQLMVFALPQKSMTATARIR